MIHSIKTLALAALSTLSLTAPVQADMLDDVLKVGVRTGWRAADGTHMAALQFDLAPGWKTYWRQPGDVGIPPEFNWSHSTNLKSAQVIWPTPDVTWDAGMRTIGYDGRVILPLSLVPDHSGAIEMEVEVLLGVCADVCIPANVRVAVTLPPKGKHDATLAATLADQPVAAQGAASCKFTPTDYATQVQLRLDLPRLGASEDVALEVPLKGAWISTPKVRRDGRTLIADLEILTADGGPIALNRSAIRTTVFADGKAVEFTGCTAF